MKTLKYLSFMLILMVCSAGFVSCSDDDDEGISETTKTDFYVTCSLSGGGYTTQDLNYLQALINAQLALDEETYKGLTVAYAIYEFDEDVDEWKDYFMGGLADVDGTLKIVFSLKTKDGKTVKNTTLNVTQNGCTKS